MTDIHRAYMDLPTKRAHTKITGRIDCLVCTSKDFSSLTQYKQHLVNFFNSQNTACGPNVAYGSI